VRCLAVDTENHLFLAGLGMVPTHNSGAEGEMLPAAGPVKVPTIGNVPEEEKQRADAFEADFNYFLTEIAKEYYPDTMHMLMQQSYCGIGYKKVYRCPIRQRPVSESILAPDLIVSEEATDLDTAHRVTHRIQMMKDQLRRLQIAGAYADIPIGPANYVQGFGDSANRKIKESEGITISGFARPEDTPHIILESDYSLDIDHLQMDGYWERKTPEGLPLPYRIAVERGTQKVFGIWRNWNPDDKFCRKKNMYVKFGMIPALGFHDWGFLQLLGNQTRTLRAIWRILIDAGMLANFPGGIKASRLRTTTNEIAPGPGEFQDVDIGPQDDINKLVMPMPYKDISASLVQFSEIIKGDAMRLGGTVQLEVGEGRTNVPVGTVMAAIEQQVQVMAQVYKRNHQAQKVELRKIRELFAENPGDLTSLVRERPRDPTAPMILWEKEQEFMDLNLMPASDPNIPARLHRLMASNVLAMLAQQIPNVINVTEVAEDAVAAIGKDPKRFVIQPDQAAQQPAPPPDPKITAANIKAQSDLQGKQIQAQTAEDRMQVDREHLAVEASRGAADNETERQIAHVKAATDTVQPYHDAASEHLAPQPPAPTPIIP